MRARRVLRGLLVMLLAAAGAVLLRRLAVRRRDRVDLYFADGSLVTLADGSADAEALLGRARQLLAAARAR